ncbi:hypothetical protein PLICRDRAFT_47178 [Plicaturopsis crispa FD-325 SS-3]|uniref:Uncharacterized protein n=1 Tax=Plicaturopsis crispa FD-325 SS-3 TaxID=944288 RepID=A0A0C9SKD3_PLICR|nr:hypothetical protein PLICRDRAFT_47178 [Plicaturopsis crispa FD-325 SS-3]
MVICRAAVLARYWRGNNWDATLLYIKSGFCCLRTLGSAVCAGVCAGVRQCRLLELMCSVVCTSTATV